MLRFLICPSSSGIQLDKNVYGSLKLPPLLSLNFQLDYRLQIFLLLVCMLEPIANTAKESRAVVITPTCTISPAIWTVLNSADKKPTKGIVSKVIDLLILAKQPKLLHPKTSLIFVDQQHRFRTPPAFRLIDILRRLVLPRKKQARNKKWVWKNCNPRGS